MREQFDSEYIHSELERIAGLPLGAVFLGAFPRLSSHRPTPTVGS